MIYERHMKTVNHELEAHMYTGHCMYSIYMYMYIVYVNGVRIRMLMVCVATW